MAIASLGPYDIPSRSRQELYGDDILISVWWKDNRLFCAAAMFRAPKAMTWGDFKSQLVDPWAGSDPEYDASHAFTWGYDGEPFTPQDDKTLEELGIGHKHVISMAG